MYTVASTMEQALEVARKFLDIGFDVTISKIKNRVYEINAVEK
ncbi:hypothetical protein [Cytobacillus sp.]|nr:hypothetical protein [Cytobacillus sp.]